MEKASNGILDEMGSQGVDRSGIGGYRWESDGMGSGDDGHTYSGRTGKISTHGLD
jgi:hypothetical protein